ncbi:hypothetical protein EV177_005873 [Coemansia sp. RSA 1804]|nr:hypothetical protein EV177_005873 [Coemansia sp. RSA 1804]
MEADDKYYDASIDESTPFAYKNNLNECYLVDAPKSGSSILSRLLGKSSLLSALIGEMTLVRGNIMVPTIDSRVAAAVVGGNKYKDIVDISNEGFVLHDIAYVGQETWLRNATFRDNILFGEEYEKERYEEVLRVCALKPDLRIFPAGDRTEIGERGVTLSGGQKQRVALARAVYSHRRILLIDDCLSAVDAHTGKHILMECLLSKTKLMQGRTRVLITHHVPMCLPYADFMVMMNKGHVVLKGAPQDLKAQGVLTNALKELDDKAKNADKDKQPADKEEDGKDKNIETNEESTTSDLEKSLFNLKSEDEYTEERLRKIAEQKNLDPNIDLTVLQGILVKEEEREEGRVKFEVWKTFIDICGGNSYWATVVAAMVVAEVFSTMKTYAIRLWVSSNESDKPGGIASSLLFSGSMDGTAANMAIYVTGADAYTAPTKNSPAYWLSIYMFVSALGAFWEIFDMYITCYGGIRAEKSLHKKLLCSVMHATPQFFDSTPVGRIVIVQYLKLDQEAPSESAPENKPSALWPKTGNVEFENLVAEYVPGVPVLHGISLSVHHGEKVGVVGRTGAGKSTMSLALLRFVEATEGRIVLDGVDISKIGLDNLRRNITIIPQDPVLFNGTIRYNIDPFEEYPDELIWDALNRVHMTREQTSHATSASTSIVGIANDENGKLQLERMSGVFSSLDDKIEQNGHSLSAGQRQLVAMARALVRRSKLVIMDEATASVDFDTDERLQRTIRGYEFANSTILCIAHRLRTVIDYDRVLVLDKGKVAEFDTPKNLLQKKDGIFRGMCEKSGEIEHLLAIANH